jgi:hypothetical protein
MIDSLINWLVEILTGFRDSGAYGQFQFLLSVLGPLAGVFLLAWTWGRWRFRERLRSEEQRDARLSTLAEEIKALKADLKAERTKHDTTQQKLADLEVATVGFLGRLDAELDGGNHGNAVEMAQAYIDRQATELTRAAELLAEYWVGLAAEDGPSAYAEAESIARLGLGVSPEHDTLRQLAAQLAEAEALEATGLRARIRSAEDRAEALARHRDLQGNFEPRVNALIALGDTNLGEGRYALAYGLFDAAARLAELAAGSRNPVALIARLRALNALTSNKNYTRGLPLADRLIPLLIEEGGPEADLTLLARVREAGLRIWKGDGAEAEKALRVLLPLMERAHGPEHSETLRTRLFLASAVQEQGRYADAEKTLRMLLPLMERVEGPEDHMTLSTRHNIAHSHLEQGKVYEAEAALRDILPIMERVLGQEHPSTLVARHNFGSTLLERGKAADAGAVFRALLTIEERVMGPEHHDTVRTRLLLARALLEQRVPEQVMETASLLPKVPDLTPVENGREAMLRGWLADLDGDPELAETLLDRADAILSHLDPEHYMRLQLARYRETRGPDGEGGTMIAAEFSDSS